MIDTTGTERFNSMVQGSYRRANSILYMYNCTHQDFSFKDVDKWIHNVNEQVSEETKLVLVGTGIDTQYSRIVTYGEASEYAKKKGMSYYEVGVDTFDLEMIQQGKWGQKVVDMIDFIVCSLSKQRESETTDLENTIKSSLKM